MHNPIMIRFWLGCIVLLFKTLIYIHPDVALIGWKIKIRRLQTIEIAKFCVRIKIIKK